MHPKTLRDGPICLKPFALTKPPGALVPPALERIRNERGPFATDDDLLLAAFYEVREYGALKAAGPIDTEYSLGATPLVTLVKAIAARPDIKSVRIMNRNVGDRAAQP